MKGGIAVLVGPIQRRSHFVMGEGCTAPAELHACGQPPFWGPQSGSAVRLEELEAGEAEEISKAA